MQPLAAPAIHPNSHTQHNILATRRVKRDQDTSRMEWGNQVRLRKRFDPMGSRPAGELIAINAELTSTSWR